MKICPGCSRSTKTSERIETDRKTRKNWLITFCAKCGYNYEIEEYKGKVKSAQEELDSYPDQPAKGKFWPQI